MKDIVKAYLRENVDESINIELWDSKDYLPLFLLERYTFYKVNILGKACLLIQVIDDIPGIDDLKKHLKVIRKSTNEHLVLLFKSISTFRRKSLLESHIPFIIENGQMYLPFLGLDMQKITEKNIKEIKKFSPMTQLIFLYFLYNKDLSIYATELANIINTSLMTTTRALNELYQLDLLTYEISGKTGRSKVYKRINDIDYYDRGFEYLKNPVNKVVYVEKSEKNLPFAGLEALSMQSMINPPKRPVRAIFKKFAKEIDQNVINNPDKIADMDLIEIEIWDYDPNLLVKDNMVDIVSLTMSIKDINDERVEQAIEERLKGETWFTA
ncbi:hypothetical protein SH2C18_34600 [Clostridium sediminicola]|uniref:hypothetical protein n=1 Tax=Clostridium sediminicola TaxID=3114879 RepID=UPI0031F21E39